MIYVIDDEEPVAEVIGKAVTAGGWPVKVFTDPNAALGAFIAAEPKPRLMITDYRMPGMNGLELFRHCKTLSPRLKAIMLTGNLSQADFDHLATKPDVLLQKPVTGAQLRKVVESLLLIDHVVP